MAVERGDAAGLNKAAVAGWLRGQGSVRQHAPQPGFVRIADTPQRDGQAPRLVTGLPASDKPQPEPAAIKAQPEHSARQVVSGRGLRTFHETITQKPHLYRLPHDTSEGPSFTDSDVTRYVESNRALHATVVARTRENLSHPDEAVRAGAVRAAGLLDEGEERDTALRIAFADPEVHVRTAAFDVAGLHPAPAEVEQHIAEAIPDPYRHRRDHIDNRLVVAAMAALRVVPDIDDREQTLWQTHADLDALGKDLPVEFAAALVPPDRRWPIVAAGIQCPNVVQRVMSVGSIQLLPPELRADAIIFVLVHDTSVTMRKLATELMVQVPFEDRGDLLLWAENEVGPIRGTARKVRIEHDAERSRHMLAERTEGEKFAVLQGQLDDISIDVQHIGSRNLSLVSEENRRQLIAAHPLHFQTFVDAAGAIPLYDNHADDFARKELGNKTGSMIFLLDRVPHNEQISLRGHAIMRTEFPLISYLQWEKAYEAGDFWEELGHVPVEPIIRVRTNYKNPMHVTVMTRVLNGPTVSQWMEMQGAPYKDEIAAQVEKIKDGLQTLGINHGHTHPGNFVVVFERDENGVPDLARPPRVYVIDFDMAKDSKE